MTQHVLPIAQLKKGFEPLINWIQNMEVRLTTKAITDNATLDARNNGLNMGLIDAKNHCAVKRDRVDKLNKGIFQVLHSGIAFHVIFIDIGNNSQGRREH